MRNQYIAYTKDINGANFYFVKHLLVFSEYQNIDPVLAGYGMHQNFEKSCTLAGITDKDIQQQIKPDLSNTELSAKIININEYSSAQKKHG